MTAGVLERARSGDERAFRELVEPHRHELHLRCYRMLGSMTDADDLLQETLLAAWRGLGRFQQRASLRTWLDRIATHRCLNAIRDAKRRPPTEPVPPFDPPTPSGLGETTWLQPYPDSWLDRVAGPESRATSRENVELAFIVALQRLPPRQTAALVLCDVLGFSLAEAAVMIDSSHTATKGLLQRARATARAARVPRAPGHRRVPAGQRRGPPAPPPPTHRDPGEPATRLRQPAADECRER